MRYHIFTEAGGHPHNEDAVRVAPHPLAPDVLLVALADGQGGRSGGARAAQLAVDTAVALAGESRPDTLRWPKLLSRVDAAVAADPEAGFTTLVAFAVFVGMEVRGAACGDSALMLAEFDGQRVLTEGQQKNPPVGSGDAVFVPFSCVTASDDTDWQLVATSDGVWKYAGWDAVMELSEKLRGEQLIEALQARARLPGSGQFPDDFTLAVISSDD